MSVLAKSRTRVTELLRDPTLWKFGIVGISGIVVNNAVLWLLTQRGMGDVTAAVIATECAIISNFVGNSLWTWRSDREGWQRRFLMFQLISLFTLVLTVALFWAFHNLLNLPLLVANTVAIGITFIINFLLNKKITWAKKTQAAVLS